MNPPRGIKAVIGISSWNQTRSELRKLAIKIDAGKRLPAADYQLDFPTPMELLAELPPKRLQLLRELKAAGPMSVYALAKQLGRNYSNVHGDIQRLLALNLVEKNSGGQVLVPFDDIVVQVDASLMAAA
jgi:predicted transcriptional regulator